ncbi:MAG: HD domain-containing protein [Lachnospiraceae bacterium]|nr:HD domain-containing protein [Lachnospiraceae bacterium]
MKYIKDLKEGDRVSDIYLVKQKNSATTKNGKPYDNIILQDKTGTIDAKNWEPNSPATDEFDTHDHVEVVGEVTSFNGALQINIKRARKCSEGEYDASDYLPVSPFDIEEMYKELLDKVDSVKTPCLNRLLNILFREDEDFIKKFKMSSAAKSVHHSFVGGLLQHTLAVTRLCDFYCEKYEKLNRDLLITAALCHDIAKTKELSLYPDNDYTDQGNFLGHIVMGVEMIDRAIHGSEGKEGIKDFPPVLENELKHCILAHHGEFEFGSPKKPAIMEALALNFADDTDAKLQIFSEMLDVDTQGGWLGYKKLLDSNVTATKMA